ncbi:MAG: hypothetical protein LBK57_01205 [Clostridiales Family XIII bacterium]|jgi:hypothetical protein|nr:hypothetical protein [Clostridiales Family XIII bacterium]
MVAVIIVVSMQFSVSDQDYFESARIVLIGYSTDMIVLLNQAESNPSVENRTAVFTLIDKQLKAIKTIQKFEEIPDEYIAFHDGLLALCKDEEICLTEYKALLSSGQELSKEEIANYMALRSSNYQWLMHAYAEFSQRKAIHAIFGIF